MTLRLKLIIMVFCLVVATIVSSPVFGQAPPAVSDSSVKVVPASAVPDTGIFNLSRLGSHDTLVVVLRDSPAPHRRKQTVVSVLYAISAHPQQFLVNQTFTRVVRHRTIFGSTIVGYEYPFFEVRHLGTGYESSHVGIPRELFRYKARVVQSIFYLQSFIEQRVTPIDE